ncbi:MAG: DHH family phosphoesterase [Chitinispirillaceae bacterium]
MITIASRVWAVQNLELIRGCIESAHSVVISGHKNPDGDSLGAMLSLGLGLESLGKQVHMLCEDEIPSRYRDLPGMDRVVRTLSGRVDLAVAVDCGSREMVGAAFGAFRRAGRILEIDHHSSRSSFGDYSMVDEEASCAGELVYFLLEELGVTVTREIAQNILTSIIVETNSFRLPGLRPQTFEICAELLRTGVEFSRVAESVYWVSSRETELLGGICLSRCSFSQSGQLVHSFLTRGDLQKVGAREADGDPVVEKLRAMNGVKLAVLFREKDTPFLRVSFRSREGIDVAALAEKFGGGGHFSAAGCTVPNTRESREQILRAAGAVLKKSLPLQNSATRPNLNHQLAVIGGPVGGEKKILPEWKERNKYATAKAFAGSVSTERNVAF